MSHYSRLRHRDELLPTFSPTVNFKCMVDIVATPIGTGQRKYLVLAPEDLMNQVEGWCTTQEENCPSVSISPTGSFRQVGCVGQIIVDGERLTDGAF